MAAILWLTNSGFDDADDVVIEWLNGTTGGSPNSHVITQKSDLDVPVVPADIDDYDLVIISEATAGSSTPGSAYIDVDKPILLFEPYCLDEMLLASSHADRTSQTSIVITNASHPLAAGFSGTVTVLSTADTLNTQTGFGPDWVEVATDTGSNGAVIGCYDTGAEALSSDIVPNRRAIFTCRLTAMPFFNQNALDLVDASVAWLLGTATPEVSATINGGGSITAAASQQTNQILRPASTITPGTWDTGPTTGQSLDGYTSDDSDSTYIEDTTA